MTKSLLIACADKNRRDYCWLAAREYDYNVETVSSGLECLHHIRRWRPDVLVLEHYLPWGGGDGVLARMREEGLRSLVPVVLVCKNDVNLSVNYLHQWF